MIVAKSTTQNSEFLVPSQFHPQHFPVELPFQLKRISLLIYFMAIYRCPTYSVIRSKNWPYQKIHTLPTYYISTYITACSNIPANLCLHLFQAQQLTTIFFRSIKIPSTAFSSTADNILFQLTRICLLYSMTFPHFSVVLVNNLSPCWQPTDKFTKLISIFKTQRKSSFNQPTEWEN